MKCSIRIGILSGLFSLASALAGCAFVSGVETNTREAAATSFTWSVGSSIVQRDPLPLLVSYSGLMSGIIDWSAYGIFTVSDSTEPLDDSDWTAAGMAAINIVAASTLLTLPGSGQKDIERLADPDWREMVAEMQNASVFVAAAVQARDRNRLSVMADLLADSCKACHDRFREPTYERSRDFADLR